MTETMFSFDIDDGEDVLSERYRLAVERICSFGELPLSCGTAPYFERVKALVLLADREMHEKRCDRETNEALYHDMMPEHYPTSFLDPSYAAAQIGAPGPVLSCWYAELMGIIPFSYEGRLRDIAPVLETTIQICRCFEDEEETKDPEKLKEIVTDIIYDYIYDYADEFIDRYMTEEVEPKHCFARDLILHADLNDLSDTSYLYRFGEWITKEQLDTARLLASLPEETIRKMAFSYVDGYIRGFALTGKSLRGKTTVGVYLPLGFERFMREAILQFEEAGLTPVLCRFPVQLINKKLRFNIRPGFYGAVNQEYSYDHSEDMAFFWGDRLKALKLEAMKRACEKHADALSAYSGHACVEIFGETGSEIRTKAAAAAYTDRQKKLNNEYRLKAHEIQSAYMKDEETSFTIISWPTVSIADAAMRRGMAGSREELYREIFMKIVEINTLPVGEWQQIQQCLCDALDTASYVEVKGAEGNDTDIRVALHDLADPSGETNFENCLADVNIPAGEVFTSPVLKGTDGMLHVGYVYIEGFLFKDLRIRFENGRVADYSCGSFPEDPAEGKRLVERVIFGNREHLPLGEFAIGTNTIAFMAARQYFMEDKLPVLIAEKTGPHFAVGDTCYSYEEEIVSCNPDGKRIVARSNECSDLRHESPKDAYFGVHTDITVPYEELGAITAVAKDGTRTDIIRSGRFVLAGTDALNKPFE